MRTGLVGVLRRTWDRIRNSRPVSKFALPPGLQRGDALIVKITARHPEVEWPPGWTLVGQWKSRDGIITSAYRIIDGTEGTFVTMRGRIEGTEIFVAKPPPYRGDD